jgi:flagellar M-ring protein FliF
MPPLAEFAGQFGAAISRQSKINRILVVLVLVGVAAAVFFQNLTSSEGPYVPLHSSLHPQDASAIVAHLEANGVQYKLSGDGLTVSVPQMRIPEMRMQLAQLNLPTGGGTGFEWFDKPPIGMTDRMQEINYVRALQGELARSISTLRAVRGARVLLATRPRTTFLRPEENKPSASVVLELAPGENLSSRNVEGILNLVAFAVDGLETERVSLVDARSGELLNRARQDPQEAAVEGNRVHRQHYEQELEQDIESMLERWVGPGRVVARVYADIDFTQTQTTKTTYDDDAKAVESETLRIENIDSERIGTKGVVGSTSVLSDVSLPEATTGGKISGPSASVDSENIYLVSRTDTTTVEPSNQVKLLTVAVMVDYKEEAAEVAEGAEEGAAPVMTMRSSEELAQFTTLVQNAVGYTEETAEKIDVKVECVPFAQKPEAPVEAVTMEDLQRREMVRYAVTWGVYGLLGLLVALFVLRPIMQALVEASRMRFRSVLAEGGAQLPGGPEGLGQRLPGGADARRMLERAESSAANKRVDDLMATDPQAAASLIRKWLEEERH